MAEELKIFFHITPTSGVPIYRQLFDQVKIGIATGHWKVGDFLPSVRDVSSSLEINPMTVSKAYSLLEKNGTIQYVRGQGMRVPELGSGLDGSVIHNEEVLALLREAVGRAQQLSLNKDYLVEKLKEIWEGYSHE